MRKTDVVHEISSTDVPISGSRTNLTNYFTISIQAIFD